MTSRHLSYDAHSLSFTDESDKHSANDDFVSFPTLPDPEQTANRSFSKIITKTLRKVTNNASNLVHNYTSPRQHHGMPDLPTDPSDSQSIYNDHSPPTTPSRMPHVTARSVVPSVSSNQHESVANGSTILSDSDQYDSRSRSNSPKLVINRREKKTPADLWLPYNNSVSSSGPVSPSILQSSDSVNGAPSTKAHSSFISKESASINPRVTSDDRSLLISTMGISRQHAPLVSPSDVNILNADGMSAPSRPISVVSNVRGQTTPPSGSFSSTSNSKRTLSNRISSIFNNLPNDIELSDDSASDIETIPNESMAASPIGNRLSPRQATRHKNEPAAKVEKQQRQPKVASSPSSSASGSLSKASSVSRKISANLSASILDNARSIITNNITGKSSTASSMIGDIKKKRKRRLAKKTSDNPLKNGGIPKKYWINDSFVSDCLNCFRPFTAFRRKHHCRFCGQIFCSSCTLFISYSQFKHEMRDNHSKKEHGTYYDKLRVCKPCYSDVIVYLSDDSSNSSEDEAESEHPGEISASHEPRRSPSSEHPLMRYRSMSSASRRDSVTAESIASAGQRGVSKDNMSSSGTPTLHSTKEASQKSSDVSSYRYAPQMAIPTTRTGEAIEIPVSRSPHMNAAIPMKQNLASIAIRNAVNNSGASVSHEASDEATPAWYSPFHDTQEPNLEVGRPNSLENLNKLYNSFVHRNPYRLTRSTSERVSRPGAFHKARIGSESERDEEVDYENDDDKVMSLYTALHNSVSTEPRPSQTTRTNPLSQSMFCVPTLHEFPAMAVNDKYIPVSMNFTNNADDEQAPAGFGINANKNRSDHRSSERAKASLNRMRQKRMSKLKNRHDLVKNTLRLPILETTIEQGRPAIVSPQSTPSTPTPMGHSMTLDNTDPFSSTFSGNPIEGSLEASPVSPMIRRDGGKISPTGEAISSEEQNAAQVEIQGLRNHFTGGIESLSTSTTKIYDTFMQKLLQQSLADCDIADPSDQKRWGAVLFPALQRVYQLRITDTLDIKQYVKFKKLSGATIEDTHVVDGLFITKNIDSKRMQSRIKNPKIALLMFPLEYLKHKEQYISLRIVNSQQSVYLENLVSRLVSLEPDIIVVGDSICGFALKLLEEANVTVLSNVKPQVIERISRYTKGDIFSTVNDLFFKKGSLGTCDLFEVRKFVHNGTVKTYSFFTGCDVQNGFTICLRGSDSEALSGAKYTTETLTPALWNAKFEKSFFIHQSLVFEEPYPRPGVDILQTLEKSLADAQNLENEMATSCIQSIEHYGIVNYVKLFTERYLSVSPAVSFLLPGVLLNLVNAFVRYVDFATFTQHIQSVSGPESFDVDWISKYSINVDRKRFERFSDMITMLQYVCNDKIASLSEEFNNRIRSWSNSIKFNCYQLYPIFHRSFHVLYSTVSIKHATPCTGPVIVVIDFHTDNDKCLGVFLDQALQEAGNVCEDCSELLLDHYRTYVHNNAKVDLIIERVDTSSQKHEVKGRGERMMWSHCPECNYSTPITYINDEIFYLSLGKFFELCFWSSGVIHDGPCPHDYFKKHIKYFGYNDVVIRIEYSEIQTYEVVVPKKRLESTLETDIGLKIEAFDRISHKMETYFKSILDRLSRVKLDAADKAEAGYRRIEEMKESVSNQRESLLGQLRHLYESTLPDNYVSLNAIQRDLQDIVVTWDADFHDFEAEFLPSEVEINKITQSHLRDFLIDRFDHDVSQRPKSTEKNKKDDSSKSKSGPNSSDASRTSPESIKGSSQAPPKRPVPQISKFRVPSAVIEDKITQIQQSFEKDINSSGKTPDKSRANSITGESIDTSALQNPKRVQDLTNYFNQMTLEFQKQREEALERQSHKYKTLPIVNSQPTVEIYGNIEDVVDVPQETRRTKPFRQDPPTMAFKSPGIISRKDPFDEAFGKMASPSEDKRKSLQDSEAAPKKPPLEEPSRAGKEASTKSKLEIPQPERNSLLKSLMNYWADRSASLWTPLEYPLEVTEHTFADSDVIVREDEPSSLVAFCLSSNVYKQKIQDMANASKEDTTEVVPSDAYQKKADQFTKVEKKFKKKFAASAEQMSETERIMIKARTNHLKYQFADGNTVLSCKIFYSEQFEAFRKACGLDKSFIQSLSRCIKWNSTGGKSGSNFLKTLDNRYIVKELSKSELESFVSIAPFYFKYISQSTFNTLTTAIAKIFGFYQIEIKNGVNGKTFKMDFLIMENLFYNCKCSRIFDLKGSMRNRHVQQTGKENEVLLDENMIEYIYESPVFVKEHSKKLLRGSLFNDTSFLSAMDVMDYSLVVGIDDNTSKLHVGIIDWLRTFTWDKKVENWVKGSTLVGKKGKDPTIVTPKQYRIRFREAMDRYILEVPDIWYEGKAN